MEQRAFRRCKSHAEVLTVTVQYHALNPAIIYASIHLSLPLSIPLSLLGRRIYSNGYIHLSIIVQISKSSQHINMAKKGNL